MYQALRPLRLCEQSLVFRSLGNGSFPIRVPVKDGVSDAIRANALNEVIKGLQECVKRLSSGMDCMGWTGRKVKGWNSENSPAPMESSGVRRRKEIMGPHQCNVLFPFNLFPFSIRISLIIATISLPVREPFTRK